ncbi:dihydrolipoamide acetyltransferase family protein [Variovorax ginsengisoli]|uniref:Dihydrolipoamide acetyltransferase component of pyruvate dehydrogenase complex n=1 Tax=Variovorax ginsengisoli TaxID=363844 RepID=A0ABT8SJC3_9BURK|nr:dihydrolipoamide acetyltransferase family protein [Variovorax ginsengisoli]MDN8618481.1 dihydrolipoamide acetyltransferase family protein [Variovorax ginsengisoli]MDO1537651.1 dihydrolipoamide acetyltransferase family protein [Variovorax ginsengisoli]
MRRELLMPKLGLTMAEGVMTEWLLAPGTAFKAGDSIFIIESEKAAVEVPADADGVLLEITAQPGETVPVGAAIGWWDDTRTGDDTATAPAADAHERKPGAPAAVAPAPAPAKSPATVPAATTGGRVVATPLARRLAQQRGVDLRNLRGSGPRGRIRADDVPVAQALPAAAASTASGADGSLRKPTAIESTIAQRLVAAKQQIPHFYLSSEVEVSALLTLRSEINAAQSGVRLTLNDFLVAAVGRALADMPQSNRVWTDDGILSLPTADVGMAVNTERGLMVAVVRDAGRLPVSEVSRSAKALIERARIGKLGSVDMAGGAITVSNAGMHDVTAMSSIINPGQAMILGVGSVRELFRPDATGAPGLRREITLVLSADHRVLDGASAAEFLKRIREHLARPLGLMVS